MSSVWDLVFPVPKGKQELSDYVTTHYAQVTKALEQNHDYRKTLEAVVGRIVDKYTPYLGGLPQKIGSISRNTVGLGADAWLATRDIVGSLGGKFLNLIGQIPEKLISAPIYAIKTGNYLDAARNIMEGLLSYVPGLTVVDEGLTRIIKQRIVKDIVAEFEIAVGIYKPWTSRLADKLSDIYTGVKDRVGNVFRPDYEGTPVHALDQ